MCKFLILPKLQLLLPMKLNIETLLLIRVVEIWQTMEKILGWDKKANKSNYF
jgi:hypothetical protein